MQQILQRTMGQFSRLNLFFKSSIIVIFAFLIVLVGYGIGRLIAMLFIQFP